MCLYPNDSISLTKIDYLRNQLLANPDIKNVSFSFGSPSSEIAGTVILNLIMQQKPLISMQI